MQRRAEDRRLGTEEPKVLQEGRVRLSVRDADDQFGHVEHAGHFVVVAERVRVVVRPDLDVLRPGDPTHPYVPQDRVEEGPERQTTQVVLGLELSFPGLEVSRVEILAEDEPHAVIAVFFAQLREQCFERGIVQSLDRNLLALEALQDAAQPLKAGRGVRPEVVVTVLLDPRPGEFAPDGGRREVNRRLVGVRHERLLDLQHRQQEVVLAEPLQLGQFAQVRGLLADLVARGRFRRHPLAAADPLLNHHLGFLLGQLEAGLAHQLAERVDAGTRLFFEGGELLVLVDPLATLGDPLALGGEGPLDLGAFQRHFAHRGFEVRGEAAAEGVRQLFVVQHRLALPLQVLVGGVRVGREQLAGAPQGLIDDDAVLLFEDRLGVLGLVDQVALDGRRPALRGRDRLRARLLLRFLGRRLQEARQVDAVGQADLDRVGFDLTVAEAADDAQPGQGVRPLRVDLEGGVEQFLGVVEAVGRDGPDALNGELVAEKPVLFTGHGQGPLGGEHGRRVLGHRGAVLVEHRGEEVVVARRGGQRLAEFDGHLGRADAAFDSHRQGRVRGLRRAEHEGRAVAAERGQLGRVKLGALGPHRHAVGPQDRRVDGDFELRREDRLGDRRRDRVGQADDGAAGQHGEAVQVLGVHLRA